MAVLRELTSRLETRLETTPNFRGIKEYLRFDLILEERALETRAIKRNELSKPMNPEIAATRRRKSEEIKRNSAGSPKI